MLAFDSNVFIYILDKNPEFFDDARAALRRVADEPAVISSLVYAECLAKPVGQAFVESRRWLDIFCQGHHVNVLPLDTELAVSAATLRNRHPSIRTADAIHLATALGAGAEQFITNDRRLHGLDIGLDIVPLENFAV